MSPATENRLTRLVKRFLDVIWVVLIVSAVAWPIATLVIGLHIPPDPDARHTDVSVYSGFSVYSTVTEESATGPGEAGSLIMRGQAEVWYNNTRALSAWYLSAAIPELMGFILLFGLYQLRKLFTQLEQGAWYADENIPRIRKLGWAFVGWHLLLPLVQYFGGRAVLGDMSLAVPGIEIYPAFEFNILGLFAGLAIIVLSGVMREAAGIRREQSLTI